MLAHTFPGMAPFAFCSCLHLCVAEVGCVTLIYHDMHPLLGKSSRKRPTVVDWQSRLSVGLLRNPFGFSHNENDLLYPQVNIPLNGLSRVEMS